MESAHGPLVPIRREFRCSGCGALLGKLEGDALKVRRGDLEATIDGDFRAAVVCYRRHCRTMNVLKLPVARQAIAVRRR